MSDASRRQEPKFTVFLIANGAESSCGGCHKHFPAKNPRALVTSRPLRPFSSRVPLEKPESKQNFSQRAKTNLLFALTTKLIFFGEIFIFDKWYFTKKTDLASCQIGTTDYRYPLRFDRSRFERNWHESRKVPPSCSIFPGKRNPSTGKDAVS